MAVEHLVFMNRKSDSSLEESERLLRSAKRDFRALPGVLDVRIAVADAASGAPRRSYGFLMRFTDSESLAAYLQHPVHVAIGNQLQRHFTDFAVHDLTELAE